MGWHPGQVALLPTQIDLIPAERAQLGDAQPTAVGDQALDFFRDQVFTGAALGLGALAGAELSHFQGLAWWLGPWCCSSHAGSRTGPTVPLWGENGTVRPAPERERAN